MESMDSYEEESEAIDSSQDTFTCEDIQAMNPSDLRRFVDKTVSIKCGKDKREVSGIVYTIDPVSLSFVVSNLADDQGRETNLTVVPGHSVEEIVITGECSDEHKQLLTVAYGNFVNSNKSMPYDSEGRKKKLMEWFEKNRIPAQLAGDQNELVQVTDALFIEPPYLPENCVSRNEIILGKVQMLVKAMPD